MSNLIPKKVQSLQDLEHYNLSAEGIIEEYNRLLEYYREDEPIHFHTLFYRYYEAVGTLEMVHRMYREDLDEVKKERDEYFELYKQTLET